MFCPLLGVRQPALGGVSCILAVMDVTWKAVAVLTVCMWHQPGWSQCTPRAVPTGPSGFGDLAFVVPSG